MTTTSNNKLVSWAAATAVLPFVAVPAMFASTGLAHAGDGGMLAAANAERAKNGCPAWVMNPGLQAAAQSHADDVISTGTGHTGSDGSTPDSRAAANGWTGASIGEIQVGGMGGGATPQTAISEWMKDGHKLAFSDCTTTDAGAVFQTNDVGWTAVIDAGAR
jgi:uncharacterized protein YkwD